LVDRDDYGATARSLLSFPWDTTPLGAIDSWPAQLQLLVQVMLSSEFPMMLAWGPDYTQLYNDAFRPILGTGKHPGALGNSARDTWAEIWSEIGPLFSRVFDDGEAVWNADQRLLIERNGYSEETFFTYSYSPIYDETNLVVGLLVVATETTAQVVDRRRLSTVGALASALMGANTIEAVGQAAVDALQDTVEISAVEVNLVVADSIVRIASAPRPLTDVTDRDVVRRAAVDDTPVVLDPDWEPGQPARRVAFGIDHPSVRTAVLVGLNEQCAFDDDYQQFIRLIRQTMAASMTAALLRADEIGALRHISDTLQHAMLELASDLPTVAARYLPKAKNLTVGGDWYEVLDLGAGRRALIVGDCVGHGLEAATAMGALRNVSRALLAELRSPAEVVESLHRFAVTTPGALCATVVCAIVDLPAHTITYASAGHPPPLLIRDHKPIWLDQGLSTPLAVGDSSRPEAVLSVQQGDVLVLYTDGLIERRGESLDAGFARLAASATRSIDETVQQIADRLIGELVNDEPRDDIALVVKRIP
jgi:serine phosphatase RsbU (regulator of sigma subunit)